MLSLHSGPWWGLLTGRLRAGFGTLCVHVCVSRVHTHALCVPTQVGSVCPCVPRVCMYV